MGKELTNNYLVLKKSKRGYGVFAKNNFKKRENIIEFTGKLFRGEELPKPYEKVKDYYVQIDKNLYMGSSKGLDDFFNHSYSPNAGLIINNKKVILIAVNNIKRNEEITRDYSTTMDEDDFEIKCLCRSKKCRKIIKDFKYLPKNIKNKYIKLGIVPNYILEGIK